MSRAISLASRIELPSLHEVFELKEAIPKSNGRAMYWQVKGLYILDKKPRLLCGLTDASDEEVVRYTKLHNKLHRYYQDRLYISPLNRAKEGLYFHRDEVEGKGILLRDWFAQLPQKLKIADLELIYAVFKEMTYLLEHFDLTHHDIKAEDILIQNPKPLNVWEKLLGRTKAQVLFLNFRPVDSEIDPEESLHQMFAKLLGEAYLNEFA